MARRLTRAHILRLAHEQHTDEAIAQLLHTSVATIERVRERFVVGGVDYALREEPRLGAPRKLDGKPEAFLVALVCSTPPAAFYEAFAPAEARRLTQRIEFHYTPKHGRWLNMVESELAILSRQCWDQRIPMQAQLQSEIAAWEADRNQRRVMVNWQFKTTDARVRLKRLYPS